MASYYAINISIDVERIIQLGVKCATIFGKFFVLFFVLIAYEAPQMKHFNQNQSTAKQ